MLTRFLHIPMLPGAPNRALSFLRTETAFQAVPVFRMAYFLQTAHCAVCRKTLMLQARFANPPMPHRTGSSSCSGVPMGGGSFAPPCTPLSHHPRTAGRSDSSQCLPRRTEKVSFLLRSNPLRPAPFPPPYFPNSISCNSLCACVTSPLQPCCFSPSRLA